MKYLIPSYKRAGSVTTISYLRGIGIAPECIYVSTQTTEDRDKYQQLYGDDCTVVYREAHNCAGNRNTLVGLLEDGEEGLLLDDDVTGFQKYVIPEGEKYGKYYDLDRNGFDEMCRTAHEYMKKAGLVGEAWSMNPLNLCRMLQKGKKAQRNKTQNGASLFVKKTEHLHFDETINCFDDIEISLRYIVNGIDTVRMLEYTPKKRADLKTEGGCKEVYENGGARKTLEELDRRYYPLARHNDAWDDMRIIRGLK